MNNQLRIAYFGGEPLGVPVLEELTLCKIAPSLIVCNPDRPSGRGRTITMPPVKNWALEHNIDVWQPEDFKDRTSVEEKLKGYDLFVVVAYNRILPEWLIELPKYNTLNVHPSLLPRLRGASPIRSAILEDKREDIGVSVMVMDAKMDHGPLVAQQSMPIADQSWPVRGRELDDALARLGGALLAAHIHSWVAGEITPTEQDHHNATYCHKLTKDMGELKIDPYNLPKENETQQTLLKIRGLDGFPGTFFFYEGKRIKITDASIADDGSLTISRIIPEGKKEMDFSAYFT